MDIRIYISQQLNLFLQQNPVKISKAKRFCESINQYYLENNKEIDKKDLLKKIALFKEFKEFIENNPEYNNILLIK